MPGAFEASPEFDYDALATAEEIQRSGEEVLRWVEVVTTSDNPRSVDIQLICELHRRWFETTFPSDAGRTRTSMVANRKNTAVQIESILPALADACEGWSWRRAHDAPSDPIDVVEFVVVEANTLMIRVYDIHPFIDGNTRTTWHLRNYLLMLDGLRPLCDAEEESTYLDAWWKSTPHDHDELDRIVLELLDREDR